MRYVGQQARDGVGVGREATQVGVNRSGNRCGLNGRKRYSQGGSVTIDPR
jgi:hypothetical protein